MLDANILEIHRVYARAYVHACAHMCLILVLKYKPSAVTTIHLFLCMRSMDNLNTILRISCGNGI